LGQENEYIIKSTLLKVFMVFLEILGQEKVPPLHTWLTLENQNKN